MTRRDERGAAIVWALALVAVIAVFGLAASAVALRVAARQQAAAAADLAALAGAAAPDDQCAVAAHLADANGATLVDCRTDGTDLVVTVNAEAPNALQLFATVLGAQVSPVEATARAGAPAVSSPHVLLSE